MKTLLTILLVAFTGSVAVAQQPASTPRPEDRTPQQVLSINELNEAAKAYRLGKFVEAQRHAEMALALDPRSKIAPAFIARSIHAQYSPGVETPENRQIANAALVAYQRLLNGQPHDAEAQESIANLYGQLRETELRRQWLMQVASDPLNVTSSRVEAYEKLAQSKLDEFDASVTLLRARAEKRGVENTGRAEVGIEDRDQFNLAFQASNEALQMAEAAIYVDGAGYRTWRLKAVILDRLAILLEADGRKDEQSEYASQADVALRRANELETQQKPQD